MEAKEKHARGKGEELREETLDDGTPEEETLEGGSCESDLLRIESKSLDRIVDLAQEGARQASPRK